MNLQVFKADIESKGHKINTEKVNKNDKNNFDDINFIGDN